MISPGREALGHVWSTIDGASPKGGRLQVARKQQQSTWVVVFPQETSGFLGSCCASKELQAAERFSRRPPPCISKRAFHGLVVDGFPGNAFGGVFWPCKIAGFF